MHQKIAKFFCDAVQIGRGWDYRSAVQELESLQWRSLEEVREFQLRKLKALLEHCEQHVPFYGDELRRVGLNTRDLRSESDIQQLPIVTKKMLRHDYVRFLSQDRRSRFSEWISSGSTGEPFRFRLDKRAIGWNFAAFVRGRRWWNLELGLRESTIWSGVHNIGGTLAESLAIWRRKLSWRMKNIRIVDTCTLDHRSIRQAYDMILRFRPALIRAISSGLVRFCSGLDELGLDGTRLGVGYAIYTGEALTASQRAMVERVLSCRTICEYGCTELGLIAFECPKGGLHLNHENLILEYRRDGRPARPGEEAELIATKLHDLAAPLIRYAVGDMVVPSVDTCACGLTLPLIAGVGGRTHDKIRTPSGAVVNGLLFTHVFDQLPLVHQFRVVQDSLTEIRLELCAAQTISNSDKEFVQKAIGKVMGEGVRVEVVQVAELPVSHSGKVSWIVSNVEEQAADRVSPCGQTST